MNQQTKEWVKLIALIFSAGAGVTVVSYTGGAKLWISILLGLGTAGSNVFHALSDKPGQCGPDQPQKTP